MAYDAASNPYWEEAGPKTLTGELDGLEVSREVWRRALQACGCNESAVVDIAHETHQQILAGQSRLFDDVPDFLQALAVAAIPTALVTNGSTSLQHAKLQSVGLEDSFSAVVISAEIAVMKPDPAIFRAALDRLQVNATNVWHVGDSLQSDVAGARSAGIRTVWLNRHGATLNSSDPTPDLEIGSLLDLVPWLRGTGGLR
jgi:putative hydrolase of the HAD superfamily